MAKKTGLHLLTARQVLAAESDQNDGGGLFLRVELAGGKWVLRYTAPDGKRREMGLGAAYRDNLAQAGASLADAREDARRAGELLRQGLDPVAERDRLRRDAAAADEAKQAQEKAEQRRQALTLARCAREYHQRVIEPTRTAKHGAQWISSLENHIPATLWHAPIDTITAPQLLQALTATKPHERARNSKGETVPETVRRIRQRLDAVFEDAIFHGYVGTNPAGALRRKMREQTHNRGPAGKLAALPYVEAPALLARLRTMPGTAARALEFGVLTAARTTEVLQADWSEFDLAAALWRVSAKRMKGGEGHTVHLSPRAVELLRGQQGQHPSWVFPSPRPRPDGSFAALSNMAMLTVLLRMDARASTTVHGLCRATFSTWANETGAARPDVIEACLAHKEGDRIRAAYNRARFDQERRELLRAWAEFLSRPALSLVAA